MHRFADALAQGQLDARIPVIGRDELASLGNSLNAMAAELEDARRQREETERLRRELVAWASHDLRTPLASVQAMVEALADGLVDHPATQQRYLRTAQREIGALTRLIDDLFALAELDAGGPTLERRPNSLSDLVSGTLEGFAELAARRSVSLDGSATLDVDPVTMDAAQVERVLTNLVSNALRHTPSGGTSAWTPAARRAAPSSPLPTLVLASHRPTCPMSSTASTAPNAPATAPWAARVWAWPSRPASCAPTAVTLTSPAARAPAPRSASGCRDGVAVALRPAP